MVDKKEYVTEIAKRCALILLSLVLTCSGIFGSLVYAMPSGGSSGSYSTGTCWFSSSYCFVRANGQYGTNDVFTGRYVNKYRQVQGQAIPNWVINSSNRKQAFIQFITGKLGTIPSSRSNASHDQVGAAFTIQTMLGKHGWITSQDLATWKSLMNQSSVSIGTATESVTNTSWYVPQQNDDFFGAYTGGDGGSRYVLKINQKVGTGTRLIARIEIACGNMTSNSLGFAYYNNTGKSSVSTSTTTPGATVTFTHTVTNTGSATMSKNLTSAVKWTKGETGTVSGCQLPNIKIGAGNSVSCTDSFVIPSGATNGSQYCQQVIFSPVSSWNGGYSHSASACVIVKGVYALQPTISVGQSGVALDGTITYSGGITVTSGSASSKHAWEVDVIKFPATSHLSDFNAKAISSTGQDCSAYGNRDATYSGTGCNTIYSATYIPTASSGNRAFIVPPNSNIGDQYCFVTSVQTPDNNGSDAGKWKHSAPACVTVGVYPTVQFLGYDIKTGGNAVTSTFTIGGRTYGSWTQFGALSQGMNTRFASGAGLSGGAISSSQGSWSNLTFANFNNTVACSNGFGCYGSITYPSNVAQGLASECTTVIHGDETISANTNITGTKFICSDGTITINGDQTYAPANTSDTSLPQQIIIAKNIVIADSGSDRVGTVDSWLVATGTTIADTQAGNAQGGDVSTCSAATITTKLTTSICPDSLTIIGPVITKELDLLRTYSSVTPRDSTKAAETLNLRADAFLWASQGLSSSTPVAQTTNVTVLPPRF